MTWIKARWGAVLLAVAIFAAGVVCGAVGQRVAFVRSFFMGRPAMMAGPRGGGDRLLGRFTRHLDLTRDQQDQVDRILEESREQVMASRHEVQDQMRQLSENTHQRIVEILTDNQREQFESSSFRGFFRGPPGDAPRRGRGPRRRWGRE